MEQTRKDTQPVSIWERIHFLAVFVQQEDGETVGIERDLCGWACVAHRIGLYSL